MELNIIDMFDNIEIKNDTRVAADDLKVITELEEKFFKSRDFHFKMKELIESKEDQDYKVESDKYSKMSDFTKRKLQESNYRNFMNEAYYFINSVYSYFKDKYGCQSLNTTGIREESRYFDSYESRIKESYEKLSYFENVTKEQILDDIFEELGGFNFEDKAKQEIIEYLKKETKTYRGDKKRVIAKDRKVSISYFTWADSWYPNRIEFSSRDKVIKLLKAISLFNNDEVDNEIIERFLEEKIKSENSFGDFEIKLLKTNKIKLFKNRRVDIDFTTTTDAINFAKEFLSFEV